MDEFFSQFKDFTPDPNSSLITNFDLLTVSRGWAPHGRARTRARRDFRNAMIDEFNRTYGTDYKNLESWQNLCRVVGIDPVPETITQCRKAIRKTHVNLVDLIDIRSNGGRVTVFESLKKLRDYTRESGKYFPKNPMKEGGILKSLLRDMAKGAEE